MVGGVFLAIFAVLVGVALFQGPGKLILSVLGLFKEARKLHLRLKGSSEQKETERYVTSGKAWEDYCDTLKAAGTTLFAPGAPMTPFDQAEGYRYLTRLIRGSLLAFMECKDYENPKFSAVANGLTEGPVKLGSDNPDNLYQNCVLYPRYAYRLTVTRNTVDYLGFASQAGVYGQPGGLKTVQSSDASEFEMRNGIFEILIAPRNVEGATNFLKMDETFDEAMVIVRQTFKLREKEIPAELVIKKVGEFEYDEKTKQTGKYTPVALESAIDVDPNAQFSDRDMLKCEQVAEALHNSGLFVAGASLMFAKWAHDFQKHKNQLPLFDVEKSNNVGGDPSIRYYHSYWQLGADQALVIEATPPDCFTWNFQVNNHWMESLDYRKFRIHVNQATAKYKPNGDVVVILSTQKPDVDLEQYNWLSTTGHKQGTMCWRWIKPASFDNLPQPKTHVMDLKEVKTYLSNK